MQDRRCLPRIDFAARSGSSCCKGLDRISSHSIGVNVGLRFRFHRAIQFSPPMLTCVSLAKMAGETTLQTIAEWIRFRSTWLQEVLPETRATFPCAAIYSNVLWTVDPTRVNEVLMDLLTRVRAKTRPEEEQQHVILDGKTLRGTQYHLAEDQKKRFFFDKSRKI